MSKDYSTHRDYMQWVKKDANRRQETVENALRKAFSAFIEKRRVEGVIFSSMNSIELAKAIIEQPLILKPLITCCNIAGRAIERDLGIRNVNTYSPNLEDDQAKVLAGYIKPFLPPYLELPALSQIDRLSFIDKEIRKGKGRWEKKILRALKRYGPASFRKRTFSVEEETFELDAAYPSQGTIKIGIDVKRIEARRDIHKRCDEILNKSFKLKSAFPSSRFGSVVYYPFLEDHINVQSRLRSKTIGCLVFASESKESIENAVKILLSTLKAPKK